MSVIEKSWELLFGESLPYEAELKYSGRFKGYNANARFSQNKLTFQLSKEWRLVSQEIKVGLVQELLLKLFRKRERHSTLNMEMYHHFLRSVHIAIPKTLADPLLDDAFNRVNSTYFSGTIDKPNLRWGKASTTQLGSYDFGTDTITISKVLHPDHVWTRQVTPEMVLEYVLYHEMLHKKFKFQAHGARTGSHTAEFRAAERLFKDWQLVEEDLKKAGRWRVPADKFSIFKLLP